ncbi:hypothetical protein Daesc_006748 [Daldinia eschscholtzii]|uniref:C2H2-type domain-containing protein n=1 Tax=Daldinia eschscholtzii TaxID=292717 RepID=A0AAX6MHX8_9PEZI
MALTAQTQDSQTWGRWIPQQQNTDYPMVDPSSFIPFPQGQTNAAPIHRSGMPPQFMVGNTYTVTSPQTPQYPSGNQYMFGTYTPPSPPVVPSYKPYQEECPPLRAIQADAGGVHVGYQRDPYQANSAEVEGKTQIKYEPQMDIRRSHSPSPTSTSKTVARNAPEDGANEVIFHTEIDNLMKAIQLKSKTNQEPDSGEASYPSPPHQDEEKFNLRRKSCSPEGKSSASGRGGKDRQKRYICDFKGCGKRCAQKTQLETHKRAHTGEKPYVCEEPGCGLGFSQRGNLKSHIRQHTGEKPYRCDICNKAFAQLGNVKPHRNTHYPTKPFVCMLDGCIKTFTQRGNLKTHHNAYHRETIKRLTQKVQNMTGSEELSDEERKIYKHFTELYKNLNKGIKGRGPGRKVTPRNQSLMTPSASQSYHSQPSPLTQQQHTMYQLRYGAPDGLPYQESFGECGMSRDALPSNMALSRDQHAAYGHYDMDQASITASETTTASSSPSMAHEDQYSRSFSTHHSGY